LEERVCGRGGGMGRAKVWFCPPRASGVVVAIAAVAVLDSGVGVNSCLKREG